jgi:pimeloyl-ACP methyl ester carboxylesterase
MADGSRQFVVYVAGTQTLLPQTREPFDMGSNIQLYAGERSASYEATVAALEQAGAEPGDVVHAFGHSQGGMVLAHMALEAGFDTQTLVTFGSPVEADIGDGTLSIALRHTDDPVAALAGGGHPGPVGAPGSFVAERTVDPPLGPHDLGLPAHGIDGYARTAELLDESGDSRMAAVREVFDALDAAASVEVIEYSAQRVAPEPLPRPAVVPLRPVSPSASGGG